MSTTIVISLGIEREMNTPWNTLFDVNTGKFVPPRDQVLINHVEVSLPRNNKTCYLSHGFL
jgi:hypothetical protein